MPLPPDRVRPGYVIYEVLSGQEPLRTWARDFLGRKVPSAPMTVTQATITDLHQEFKIRIRELNVERRRAPGARGRAQPPLRGMVYESWQGYVQKALRIGLLHVTGHVPAGDVRGQAVLAPREFVALGPAGRGREVWGSVSKAYAAHVETRASTIARPGQAPALRPGRLAVRVARRPKPLPVRAQPSAFQDLAGRLHALTETIDPIKDLIQEWIDAENEQESPDETRVESLEAVLESLGDISAASGELEGMGRLERG